MWHYDKIRRTISTASVHDGLIYIPDFSGFLHALDIETGQPVWVHEHVRPRSGPPRSSPTASCTLVTRMATSWC